MSQEARVEILLDECGSATVKNLESIDSAKEIAIEVRTRPEGCFEKLYKQIVYIAWRYTIRRGTRRVKVQRTVAARHVDRSDEVPMEPIIVRYADISVWNDVASKLKELRKDVDEVDLEADLWDVVPKIIVEVLGDRRFKSPIHDLTFELRLNFRTGKLSIDEFLRQFSRPLPLLLIEHERKHKLELHFEVGVGKHVEPLLRGATRRIWICSPWIDLEYAKLLVEKARQGVDVRIVTSDDVNNKGTIEMLNMSKEASVRENVALNLALKTLSAPLPHAKIYVIDDVALVGSANLTEAGMWRNLELAIVLREPDLVKEIEQQFLKILEKQ